MSNLLLQFANFIKKTPPDGVVDSMIFEIENHRIPSHYDLHIKKFNSDELKFLIESFLIEYQYEIQNGVTEATPSLENQWFSDFGI